MKFQTRIGRNEVLWLAAGLIVFALGIWLNFKDGDRWSWMSSPLEIFGIVIVGHVIRKTYFGATKSG